jgi:tetratricopeptide (TPR) repeat protein
MKLRIFLACASFLVPFVSSSATTLRVEPYTLPAADLGPENPLPMFRGDKEDDVPKLDPAIPEAERRYLGWRTAWRCLPHRMQDGYNRDKKPRTFDSLVLENECLRATFLPQFGGRLVSLVQKPGGRELLSRNPVFQPANLALRNAWFCGGIEWNTTLRGHHFLTCSPLFAAEVRGTEGEPVLRLYEWDRVRCFPWQIDFHLPPGSPFLFARMRIVNPHNRELPMYWWTTIAVPERKDVRTLVPATSALNHSRDTGITLVPLPIWNGRDQTYTTKSLSAYDFFPRFTAGQRRWIAALDGEGRGLFETSTDRLRGRKLWGWGMGQGGQRWQEFLSLPGEAYIEIQAGLAATQGESIPMPARETWCWTEAFGALEADPKRLHGKDWASAWKAADEAIERILPRARVEQLDAKFAAVTTRLPERLLKLSSGWAALERRRCAAHGLPDPIPAELTFPTASLGADQAPWLTLLEKNELPKRDARKEPGALMTQPDWQPLLEKTKGNHWLTWWHLGNLRMEALDLDGAEKAWQASLKCQPTGWTLRNLAVLAERRGDKAQACKLMRQAWRAGPQIAALAVECLQTLTRAERYAEAYDLVATLPKAMRDRERVLLLWAKAAIEIGKLDGVERVFKREFATIREGEVSLTDLWFAFQEKRLAAAEKVPVDDKLRERVRRDFPPPRLIDFRMYSTSGR